MAVRVRNPGNYSYGHSNEHNYRHNYGQANGWYSNGQRNRTSGYPWCNQTRSTVEIITTTEHDNVMGMDTECQALAKLWFLLE